MATLTELSTSARYIQETLLENGYSCKVIEYSESTRTAREAVDRVGCSLGQIVKALIFRGQVSDKTILVLTSGANRVDENLIGQYSNEPIIRADADFVREKTGFAIGGVPPIGYENQIETYLDEDLMLFDTIWAAAGTPNAVFELTPAELAKMTGGTITKIK